MASVKYLDDEQSFLELKGGLETCRLPKGVHGKGSMRQGEAALPEDQDSLLRNSAYQAEEQVTKGSIRD